MTCPGCGINGVELTQDRNDIERGWFRTTCCFEQVRETCTPDGRYTGRLELIR